MYAVSRNLVDKFSNAFAGDKVGFSGREITDYFGQYSNYVKPYDHYGINLKRSDLFVECVYSLQPKQQYYALNNLAWFVIASKNVYPDKSLRDKLREELHSIISPDPIGLSFSNLSEKAFREDWFSCLTKIDKDPSGAITASRTLLETILKTIIAERGRQHDSSGELNTLVKQAQDVLGFDRKERQPEHQVYQGLGSIINGLASLSNSAGDRHGLVKGQSIDDPSIANLCVNAAGTIGLMFIEMHLFHCRVVTPIK